LQGRGRVGKLDVVPLLVIAALLAGVLSVAAGGRTGEGTTLVVSSSDGRQVSFVDSSRGVVAGVAVGAAPHGIALAPDGRAYVATAVGIAVVDTARRRRIALVGYRAPVGPARFGEYRPGGMGIASSPDGRRIYAGVYLPGGPSRLEVLDTARLEIVASVPVGVRPFDVDVSPDGRSVYSIDHDSFSVTKIDARTLARRTLRVAPVGEGAFDKPHYAAVHPDGRLLLPFQGRILLSIDPRGGRSRFRLSANTHQHGVALAPDGRLVIVGTGPAGEATGPPSLTVLDLLTRRERVLELRRAHEQVAVSADGRTAFLTGGYLLEQGAWDGVTAVDLGRGRVVAEIPVPGRPLGIVVLP
jgi:DNA-binding beta-propeller fold protein YncE